MIDIFDSPKFLHPREAFAVGPIRTTVLYLGYGVLLVSFAFRWETLTYGDTTVSGYVFMAMDGVRLEAIFFFVMTVYGLVNPFHRVRKHVTTTFRGYSAILGIFFVAAGYGTVKNSNPRLGSYLAIAGGLAIAAVNLYEMVFGGQLVELIEQQEDEQREASYPKGG